MKKNILHLFSIILATTASLNAQVTQISQGSSFNTNNNNTATWADGKSTADNTAEINYVDWSNGPAWTNGNIASIIGKKFILGSDITTPKITTQWGFATINLDGKALTVGGSGNNFQSNNTGKLTIKDDSTLEGGVINLTTVTQISYGQFVSNTSAELHFQHPVTATEAITSVGFGKVFFGSNNNATLSSDISIKAGTITTESWGGNLGTGNVAISTINKVGTSGGTATDHFGTLTIARNYTINDAATLTIEADGCTLNLNLTPVLDAETSEVTTSDIEVVAGLVILGNAVPDGTYTAAQLTALGFGGQFAGPGSIQVLTPIDTTDTDGDGLYDSVETGTGVFVDANNTGTDPNVADTDGDGFSDGVEVQLATFSPVTNSAALITLLNDNGYMSSQEMQDLRVGSKIAAVANNQATLQVVIEESDDLSNWSEKQTSDVQVTLPEGTDKKFFRYRMQD